MMNPDPSYFIRLPPESGIKAASQIAALLREALEGSGDLSIDTALVSSADLTTVQLLLAARKQALASGRALHLMPSAAGPLRDVLIALGCLNATGGTPSPDDAFWTPVTTSGEGLAA